MQLELIHSEHLFNADNIVSNPDIFSKKSELKNEEDISESGVKEQKKFSDDGLFSKKIFGDMDAVEDYSCDCRRLTGKFYDGKVCEYCKTPVAYVGQNINRYGWIDCSFTTYGPNNTVVATSPLAFHLIKYIPYLFLEKVIGRENMKYIISSPNRIDISGHIDEAELANIRTSDPKCLYWYTGVRNFYDKYHEILDYYFTLNGEKEREVYEFLKSKDAVFVDKIPVISIVLRPAMRTEDGLKLDEINIKYQAILKNMSMLKIPGLSQLQAMSYVDTIQYEYFALSEMIINNIKSKDGLIRNQICGTRINFSARNIISPANSVNKMDEISVPYQTFLELYKFEILKILIETERLTPKEAELEWYNGTLKYSEKLWLIMNKIVQENEVGCLLNRNPTIAIGSMLYVRIKEVKKDFTDVTLSLSNTLLSLLAGDYDGDVLNLISIKDQSTRRVIKSVLSPINLIIDPSNGRFNNSLNLERDQILGLNSLLI